MKKASLKEGNGDKINGIHWIKTRLKLG